jgi:hypothetical protein
MAKKESGRTKAFRARVIRLLERQGWAIEKQPRGSIVDIIATHFGRAKRAFIVKPHGHITRAEIAALHEWGKVEDIGLVHVHEGGGHEILFSRLYKHLSRT